jgi:hypothetical protein
MQTKPNRFLRILGIVLLSLTATMTLLGGAGTSCVALNAEKLGGVWVKMTPYKPLLLTLVIISIAAALWGIYSTMMLGRSKRGAFLNSLIFLVVGMLSSGVQYYISLTVRGSTAPNSMRLYLTIFTLVVFLIFRIPGIWQKTGFEGKTGGSGLPGKPAGLAMFLCGMVVLSTPIWGASTHVFNEYIAGYNTVNDLLVPLMVAGSLLVLGSAALFFEVDLRKIAARLAQKAAERI